MLKKMAGRIIRFLLRVISKFTGYEIEIKKKQESKITETGLTEFTDIRPPYHPLLGWQDTNVDILQYAAPEYAEEFLSRLHDGFYLLQDYPCPLSKSSEFSGEKVATSEHGFE